MPVRVSPTDATEKWANRLGGATAEITAGVNRVTVSPGQLAAQKADKWRQATNDAAEKWRRNTGAVSLDFWRSMMTQVGIPRIAQGAQAKKVKYTNFAQEFYPHLERGLQKLATMPDTTFEDRINKAVAMMRHNREFKRGSTPNG